MNSKTHFYWLDSLRVISALLVVIAHCRTNFFQIFCNLGNEYQNLFSKGFYFLTSFSDDGVLIFFILSGFLVGGQTLEKLIKGDELNPNVFLIKRGTRIMLPLAATLLFVFVVNLIIGERTQISTLIGNLLSLQGALVPNASGILWTMPYIVWFYVIIYSLILITKKSTNLKTIGVILLIASASTYSTLETQLFFTMASGVLAYYLSKKEISKKHIFLFIILALASAILTKFAKPTMSRDPSWVNTLSVPVLQVIESISLAVIISQIVRIIPKSTGAIKFDKITGKFAMFSYSLYLIHYEIIRLMGYFGFPKSTVITPEFLGYWIIEIIICILSGYLFYLIVEKHSTKIQKYLLQKVSK